MIKSLALIALFALAGPAFAATSVELRTDAAVHGGRVTLADLFDGAGASGQVVLAAGMEPGSQVVLDAGRVQAIAAAHGLSWSNPQRLSRVIAQSTVSLADASLADAAPPVPASVGTQPRRTAALTYVHNLNAGEVIQPEDLAWSKSPAYGIPADAPRDSSEVIGQAAKRALRAGAAVSQADVAAAQVIKKDDAVQVAYEADGVKLVLQAKAVTGAAMGQSVSVLNLSSKKVIEAVASGPGQALVGPEADRLKAAVRANPKLFASLR